MKALRLVVWLKVLVMVVATWATSGQAAVIGTAEHLQSSPLVTVDGAQLRDSVQEGLIALGVTSEDALARVAALSQAELQLLADRMNELPAGGVIGTVGVVFIILLLLELVGVTDIFTVI
ncbi:MAG: PA2779 family protein [Chromatocurvus sp.]